MDTTAARQLLEAALAALPESFSLAAFSGEKFRASPTASYVDSDGTVRIYMQRFDPRSGQWADWAKGSVEEAAREVLDRRVREKLRAVIADFTPIDDPKEYVKRIAERHTVVNLGQPEYMSWQECLSNHASEGDELYNGCLEELASWKKQAEKDAAAVAKKGLPPTLRNARDAFLKQGAFQAKRSTEKATAAKKAKHAAKKAKAS